MEIIAIKQVLTVKSKTKNQDPTIPAKIVKICDDKKNCLQNCIAEKIKIAKSSDTTKEIVVGMAKTKSVYWFSTFLHCKMCIYPFYLKSSFFLHDFRFLFTFLAHTPKTQPKTLQMWISVIFQLKSICLDFLALSAKNLCAITLIIISWMKVISSQTCT